MRHSSINIQNISIQSFEHNHRNYTPKYAINTAENNEYLNFTSDKYLKIETNRNGTYKKIDFDSIKNVMNAKHKATTGRSAQKSIKWFKEAVINTDEHITKEHLINLKNVLKTDFGVIVLDIAHHKDEGHIENGVKKINYHAHLIFINASENGITKKWNKSELSKLQTVVANVLEMERGTPGKNRRLEHKDYKQQQKIQTKKINRVVENFAEELAEDNRIIRKIRNELNKLKEDYNLERAQLIASKTALQSDYSKLKKIYIETNSLLTNAVSEIQKTMKNKDFLQPTINFRR